MPPPSDEQQIQAVRWRLGITTEDPGLASKTWSEMVRDPKKVDLILNRLTTLVSQVLASRLRPGAVLSNEARIVNDLLTQLTHWLATKEGGKDLPPLMRILKYALSIPEHKGRAAMRQNTVPAPPRAPTQAPKKPAPPIPPAYNSNVVDAGLWSTGDIGLSKNAPTTQPAPPAAAPAPSGAKGGNTTAQRPQEETPVTASGSQWKNQPVPDGPDKHTEHWAATLAVPCGLHLLGARVRGKKHKHEGTHCDDWFEFAVSGPWSVIAVADGAGSKKFSRVGAKASTRAAVKSLSAALKDHCLRERDNWVADSRREGPTSAFAGDDLEYVQQALHQAMREAHQAVQQAADERSGNPEYSKILGRALTINDLSATLLVAVHTTVRYKDQDHSFALACQVGDGMVAALDPGYKLTLLGEADSGDYGGETEFLTSPGKIEREHLSRKTFGFFGPLRAIMVMTDGVADDYFPNDPGMLRLHADLVLNRIVEVGGVTDEQISQELRRATLRDVNQVREAIFHECVDGGVSVAQAQAYADTLGLPLDAVVLSPPLLAAGSRAKQLSEAPQPPDRLRIWLDSYQVRGSFDDRTLVILYREALP